MATDLLREAARLCGLPVPFRGLRFCNGLDDEGYWLPRLLAACRARGWWYMGGAYGWGVSLNNVSASMTALTET